MRKKILVRGPALSRSGYGEQTRFALRSLRKYEDRFDIYLINTNWGKTGWIYQESEERRWTDHLLEKTIKHQQKNKQFDMSLQITIPNEWEQLAPINIGYTAGIETTKVSPQWIEKSFLMDRIIVISDHAKQVYANTVYQGKDKNGNVAQLKCQTPIEVVNYPVRNFESREVNLSLETDFNFLVMSQWSPRKNLQNTIEWFVKEFKNENVGLVVKTFFKSNCTIDKYYTRQHLQKLLKAFPDRKCKIYLLHGDLTDEELTGLYQHPNIKAFISLAHGEGFGLSIFEAAYNGLPIVAPAWSGYCDYMYMPVKNKKGKLKRRPQFAKVDYEIRHINKKAVWDGVLQKDSMWCYPLESSYKSTIKEVHKDYGRFKAQAERLQTWICDNFTSEEQYKKFADLVYKPNPELEDWSAKLGAMEVL